MELHFTAMGCHLPYGITQCYLSPNISEYIPPDRPVINYLPHRDGRPSWPRWLVTYRDGLPAHRWSLIQVLTRQCMARNWACNLLITSPTALPSHHKPQC